MTSLELDLEQLVDSHGLAKVLTALATVCHEKSIHVAHNWQDVSLAKRWAGAAGTLELIRVEI